MLRGCLLALLLLLVAVAGLWWAAPWLIAWAANHTVLPHDAAPQATVLAARYPLDAPEPVALRVTLAPERLRRLARESGWWLPPGLIRRGFAVFGTLRGEGAVSVPWLVLVDDAAAPRLEASLSPEQANALLAALPRQRLAGMAVTPRLAMLELATLPDAEGRRRFRIEAAGALELAGPAPLSIPIPRLIATVELAWQATAGGWQVQPRLVLDELAGLLPSLPGLPSAAWRQQLEQWANAGLTAALAERVVPAWFPTDLHLAAVVR